MDKKPAGFQMTAITLAALCFWTPACAYQVDPSVGAETITYEEREPDRESIEPLEIHIPDSNIRYRVDLEAGAIFRVEGDAEPALAWQPRIHADGQIDDESFLFYRQQAALDFGLPRLADSAVEGFANTRLPLERILEEGFDERSLLSTHLASLHLPDEVNVQTVSNPLGIFISDCQMATLALYGNVLATALMIVEVCLVIVAAGMVAWQNLGAMASEASAAGHIAEATQLNLLRHQLWQARNAAAVLLGAVQTRIATVLSTLRAWVSATSTGASASAINSARAAFGAALSSLRAQKVAVVAGLTLLADKIMEAAGAGADFVGFSGSPNIIAEGIDAIESDYLLASSLCAEPSGGPTPGSCGLSNHSINACSFADSSNHVHRNTLQNECRASIQASTHPDKDADDHIYCVADCVTLSTSSLLLNSGSTDYWQCGVGAAHGGDFSDEEAAAPGSGGYDDENTDAEPDAPEGESDAYEMTY